MTPPAPGLWPFRDDAGKWWWCVVGSFYIGSYLVEDGFVTDLASIPGPLRWLLNPYTPDTAIAAAGHDWLLQIGIEERVAAGLFYERMTFDQVSRPKRIAYFFGVIAASSNW